MKKIIAFLILMIFAGCQDKINVNLDTAPPKLVVDANLTWQKGTSGNQQTIKLTTTSNFYSNEIPKVSGAIVYVTNTSNNAIFTFVEIPSTGNYICSDFVPVINQNYTLTIVNNGITYTATEKLFATPAIENVEQITLPGLTGDATQIKFFFQDNGAEDNFYSINFKNSNKVIPELNVVEDKFFQGNQMFGLYFDDKIKAGDQLDMSLRGISQKYFNYLSKLINISGGNNGSPFSTPPATLRGNIINQTDTENYPLGYFNLSEIDTKNYVVQ
ncbi:MAG: DUF4249 domain-containing protein [Flavobacterium sp.]|nr:DUF4249 domain-containing protein [Flavobacterium sp.]